MTDRYFEPCKVKSWDLKCIIIELLMILDIFITLQVIGLVYRPYITIQEPGSNGDVSSVDCCLYPIRND